MKIFCIQNNLEYFKIPPKKPIFFLKPESSLIRSRQPFFIPEFSSNIVPVPHVVIKVSRLGKAIQPKFGHLYYSEITMGIDMEAPEILTETIKKGHPWEVVKSYDASAPLGKFITITDNISIENFCFRFCINNIEINKFFLKNLRFSINEIVSHVSENIMLKMGDLIFAGGPPQSKSLVINDILDCFIDDEKVLTLKIK